VTASVPCGYPGEAEAVCTIERSEIKAGIETTRLPKHHIAGACSVVGTGRTNNEVGYAVAVHITGFP
jgi:hypothetical protein